MRHEDSFLGLSTGGFHRVVYTEWGNAREQRLAVCVHGLTRNGRDFDVLAQALCRTAGASHAPTRGAAVVAYLARSKRPQYTFITYCADMTALLRTATRHDRRLDRHVHGWSDRDDPRCAAEYTDQAPRPERHRAARAEGSAAAPTGRTSARLPPPFESLAEAERYIREIYAPFGVLSDKLVGPHYSPQPARDRRRPLRARLRPRTRRAPQGDAARRLPYLAVLGRIRCPVLVLRGAGSDVLLPATAEEMKPAARPWSSSRSRASATRRR